MVRKAANPWLRGLLRAGKKQQRSAVRALGILLQPPKPKAAPRRKAAPAPAVPRPVAPAAAAATVPASGKWLASQYTARADCGQGALRRLRYWLYLPDQPVPPAGLPLLVMLHGCDQSATLFAQGTRMNQWAEKKGYAVLYPQQSASAHPHRCWKWYDRATQQGGGDVCVIAGLVHKIADDYRIDRSRIYICGMSAGAGMANIVALNHPALFAALGLHSGPLFGAGHSAVGAMGVMQRGASHRVDSAIEEVLLKRPGFPGMPTMLIQGAGDTVVRPVNQAHLARQAMLVNRLPQGGAAASAVKAGNRRVNPHSIRDVYAGRKLMLRVAHIDALEHAWSGGDASLAYNSAAGPDASKMLLEFFAKHRRPA